MGRYFLKRLMYIIFVFIILSVLLFMIFKLVPGDPARMMVGAIEGTIKPEAYEQMYQDARIALGLDKPIFIQYFRWMIKMLTGDFGFSIVSRMPVIDVIKSPLSQSIMLNIFNLIIVFSITIPLGISTAVRKGSVYDTAVQTVTILGYSLPTFIFAIVAMFFLAVKFQILPMNMSLSPGFDGTKFEEIIDRAQHMVLPLLVMSFTSLGGITRYVRAAMIEALRMDYIRTARAKGLREKVVIYSHAFRNSLIPIVTIMIGWFISIFSGSLMIERIFIWNGMGQLMISSLMQMDYAVVMAVNMFYIVLALTGNLIMDIGYMLVDPRVKLS